MQLFISDSSMLPLCYLGIQKSYLMQSLHNNCFYNVLNYPFLNNMQMEYKGTNILNLPKISDCSWACYWDEWNTFFDQEKKKERKGYIKSIRSNSKIIFLVYFMLQLHKPSLFVSINKISVVLLYKEQDAFINSQKSVGQTIHAVKPPKTLFSK